MRVAPRRAARARCFNSTAAGSTRAGVLHAAIDNLRMAVRMNRKGLDQIIAESLFDALDAVEGAPCSTTRRRMTMRGKLLKQ